jgi:hypothetical protein
LPQVLSGTISETRIEGQYLGHWRVVHEVLMVKLGINVEAVPIDGMANNRETIAGQVFAGMIDRYVAKQKKWHWPPLSTRTSDRTRTTRVEQFDELIASLAARLGRYADDMKRPAAPRPLI